MAVSTGGLAAIGVGSIFLYAGIKGKSIPEAFRAVISGKSPSSVPATDLIEGSPPESILNVGESVGGFGSGSGGSIAAAALRYKGTGYVWGGAPAHNLGPAGIGDHDCSSLANWVVGHDMKLAIPTYAAGTYDGSSHGPPTTVWLIWTGCTTVSNKAVDAQPGDLCVWQTHMGIATGGGNMVSALNTSKGTQETTIQGGAPGGELLFVRRLKSVINAQPAPGSSAPSSSTPPAGASGGTYTHAQLMTLWTLNGGSSATANNAACHAIQESSGRSWVTSPNPDGGTNVGLWQLDTKGKGAGHSVADLQNPDTNARLAVLGSRNGTDWTAWATPGC